MSNQISEVLKDLSERRSVIDRALRDGSVSSKVLTENYAYIYKAEENKIGMGRSGSADLTESGEDHILFTVSTLEEDRDGDIVVPMGCKLHNFVKNPVWFFGHQQWEIPIGISKGPDGILHCYPEQQRVRERFYPDKADEDAMFIFGKVQRGILNATSIAFVPISARRREDVRKGHQHEGGAGGWIFDEWDKTETSIVGVPSNAAATVEQRSLQGALRDALDREKQFIRPRLQKALQAYCAKSTNESGGCWTGWCPTCPPKVEKAVQQSSVDVAKVRSILTAANVPDFQIRDGAEEISIGFHAADYPREATNAAYRALRVAGLEVRSEGASSNSVTVVKSLAKSDAGGWKTGDVDEQEAAAKARAQSSVLPHVREGYILCKCGKRYYTEAKASQCCGVVKEQLTKLRGKSLAQTKSFKTGDRIQVTTNGITGTVIKPSDKQQSQEAQDEGHFMWDVKVEDSGTWPRGVVGQVLSISGKIMCKKSLTKGLPEGVSQSARLFHSALTRVGYGLGRPRMSGMNLIYNTPDPEDAEMIAGDISAIASRAGVIATGRADGNKLIVTLSKSLAKGCGCGCSESCACKSKRVKSMNDFPTEGDEVFHPLPGLEGMILTVTGTSVTIGWEDGKKNTVDATRLTGGNGRWTLKSLRKGVAKMKIAGHDYVPPFTAFQATEDEAPEPSMAGKWFLVDSNEMTLPRGQGGPFNSRGEAEAKARQLSQQKSRRKFGKSYFRKSVSKEMDVEYDQGYVAAWDGRPRNTNPYRTEAQAADLAADWDAGWVDGAKERLQGRKSMRTKTSTGPKSSYKVAQGSDGKWYVIENPNRTDTELGPFNSRQDAERELNEQFSTYTPKSHRRRKGLDDKGVLITFTSAGYWVKEEFGLKFISGPHGSKQEAEAAAKAAGYTVKSLRKGLDESSGAAGGYAVAEQKAGWDGGRWDSATTEERMKVLLAIGLWKESACREMATWDWHKLSGNAQRNIQIIGKSAHRCTFCKGSGSGCGRRGDCPDCGGRGLVRAKQVHKAQVRAGQLKPGDVTIDGLGNRNVVVSVERNGNKVTVNYEGRNPYVGTINDLFRNVEQKSIKQRRRTVKSKRYTRKDFDEVAATEQPPHEVALAQMYQTARASLGSMTPFDPQTGEENKLHKAMTEHCEALKSMWGEYGAKGEDGEAKDLDEMLKGMETSGPGNSETGEANLTDNGIIPEEVEAELGDEVEMGLDDEEMIEEKSVRKASYEADPDYRKLVDLYKARRSGRPFDDKETRRLATELAEAYGVDNPGSVMSTAIRAAGLANKSMDDDSAIEMDEADDVEKSNDDDQDLDQLEKDFDEIVEAEGDDDDDDFIETKSDFDEEFAEDDAEEKSEFDDELVEGEESPSEVIDDPDVDEILERYDTNKGWRTRKAGRARVRKVLAAGGRIKRGQDGRKWLVLPAVKKQVQRKPVTKSAPPKLLSKARPGETVSDFAARHGVDNIGGKWFVLDEHRQKVSTPCDTLDQATKLIASAKQVVKSAATDPVVKSLFADLAKERQLLDLAKSRCGINGN